MKLMKRPSRFGEHANAFGFLRLLFASLVIVAHTPELVDGNSQRELVIRTIGGGLTFGGIAVSGFFIISGFLITASYLNDPRPSFFMLKRVARIYPAFILMVLVCALLVRPLGGGALDLSPSGWLQDIKAMVLLQVPDARGTFATLPHPILNGAVWTIQYEFKCYLLVLALGICGLLRSTYLIVALSVICLLLSDFAPEAWFAPLYRLPYAYLWLGWAQQNFRMIGLFLAGAAFYLLQRRVALRWDLAIGAAVGLLACLMIHPLANFGLAVFGSYLIFGAAQAGSATFLKRINDTTDISYGLYLYAWPIEQLLLLAFGGSSLLLLGTTTWALAALCGWLSWVALEKPVMAWVRKRTAIRSAGKAAESEGIAAQGAS